MGLFDGIFGGGKPNTKKMEKKRDIDGLIKALKYENYFVQSDAIDALRGIKYAPGEFDEKVLDHLLAVMKDEKNIPVKFPDDNSGFWYPSLCEKATHIILNNSSTPDKAIRILINNTRIMKSQPENREDAYKILGSIFSDLSKDNNEKIFNIMTQGLENETNHDVKSMIEYELSRRIYPNLKLEDRINNYYSILHSYNEGSRNEAASCLLEHCGIDGVRALIKALKSDNENAYCSAAWAFSYALNRYEHDMDKNEFKMLLNDANEIFIKVIQNSELVYGINYFNKDLIWALNALRSIGDQSAIPALIDLQKRVTDKFNQEGMQIEHVQTRDYGGTISSDLNIAEVKGVIESINERNKVI